MEESTEQRAVSTVNFLAEQDGPPEHERKHILADAFTQLGSVTTAYLALVDYGRSAEQNVALCIVTDEADPAEIVAAVGRIFHSMFNGEAHLLSKAEQSRISLVCRPLFHLQTPVAGQ